MKDICERLREQGYKVDFDAAAEIERLRSALTTIEELAQFVLKFYQENCEPHSIGLLDFLDRLNHQVVIEQENDD